VAAVHHEPEQLRGHVDVHALELARLVVAALIAVERQVAQLLEGRSSRLLARLQLRYMDLDLGGHLRVVWWGGGAAASGRAAAAVAQRRLGAWAGLGSACRERTALQGRLPALARPAAAAAAAAAAARRGHLP
jgi:hypothetical protein